MTDKNLYRVIIASTLLTSLWSNEITGHQHEKHSHSASVVGKPALASKANKIINVVLLDSMQVTFDKPLEIKRGDIVRFVVTNKGVIEHEFSIGNEKEHEVHREMMKKMPHMTHHDGTTISLKPNEKKEITWQFSTQGNVVFACNISGHFEAGMYHNTHIK